MSKPLVSINLVVLNGEKYISHCLDSVLNQDIDFNQVELNILDNGSTDRTKSIIRDLEFRISNLGFAKFNFAESKSNLGMWGGQEELSKQSLGKYLVILSVDVIMEKDFILNAVEEMENNHRIGSLQAKIYQFNIQDLESGNKELESNKVIDTCGFKVFRSRRVINIGQGETDLGQYDGMSDIFGVEGAVPFVRAEALQSIRVSTGSPPEDGQFPTEIADHDLFWYAEDLDIAWRLRMAGWEQHFNPSVIAWHDRQTTKSIGTGKLLNYIQRLKIRSLIPLYKRKLEWRNLRWTIIKNDYIINILKDLPYILTREIAVFVYMILFEPRVLAEAPRFLKGIPRMLRKRKEIMKQAKTTPSKIRSYFS